MTLWLIGIFGIGISAFLGIGVYFYGQANLAKKNALLLTRVGSGEVAVAEADVGLKPTRLAQRHRLQQLLKDAPLVPALAELLERSGLETTVATLMGRMGGIALVTCVSAMAFGTDVVGALMMGILTSVVPVGQVMYQANKRAAAFEAQLPHALELINLYLRSGRSLPQAFVAATEELQAPIAEEFRSAAEEYRLGRPLDSALRKLAAKYPASLGFRLFTIAVTVLGQTGGNLVEVLERIRKTLDASVTYGLRLRSLTGETRMSAWILGITPGFFMLISGFLNPAYFGLFFSTTLGHWLFGLMLTLWAAGLFWIRILMRSQAL